MRAVKWRPPRTAVKNTAVVIQYCISHQNHAFTQRTHKGSLSSAHTTPSKNMVYRTISAEHTHAFRITVCLLRLRYESVLHFSRSFQHYSILSVAFLRPGASCTFVDPPEGGAQDMKNRKGGSYLHPLFQQLFPKL